MSGVPIEECQTWYRSNARDYDLSPKPPHVILPFHPMIKGYCYRIGQGTIDQIPKTYMVTPTLPGRGFNGTIRACLEKT